MKNATEAFNKVITLDFNTVLDVGSGSGEHARAFRALGKQVTTLDLVNADIIGDFITSDLKKYDCVWASHVLEHQPNVGLFLKKCFNVLSDGGILAITVPPAKSEVVGGHVSIWNAGLLLYNLILAGFDCSKASVKQYDYNISVVVKKVEAALPDLKMDYGDIELISNFFPFKAAHGFNGNIKESNWS
jgi:SAM-dependent methyltransferase